MLKPEFEHARLTIRHIHARFKNRSSYGGKKKWEWELFESAKKVLGVTSISDGPCPDCGYKGVYTTAVTQHCLKCDYILASG